MAKVAFEIVFWGVVAFMLAFGIYALVFNTDVLGYIAFTAIAVLVLMWRSNIKRAYDNRVGGSRSEAH